MTASENNGSVVPDEPSGVPPAEDRPGALPEHPKGTLVILLIYGALFAVFWAWIYFGEFLSRGAPTS